MHEKPLRGGSTGQRILDVAAELISMRGYAATSTRDIAGAVGIRQPTLYKHFASKDDILAALIRSAMEPSLAVTESLAPLTAPAAAKLHCWLQRAAERLASAPHVLSSIFTAPDLFYRERFATERELFEKVDRALISMIEQAQIEGDFREVNPTSAARLLETLFDGLWTPDNTVVPHEIVDFGMSALLADATRLPEIRAVASTLLAG